MKTLVGLVHGWTDAAVPGTRTGRSRLEHRHGWLDAVWHGAANLQKAEGFSVFALTSSEQQWSFG